jgi:hypothetical protein
MARRRAVSEVAQHGRYKDRMMEGVAWSIASGARRVVRNEGQEINAAR